MFDKRAEYCRITCFIYREVVRNINTTKHVDHYFINTSSLPKYIESISLKNTVYSSHKKSDTDIIGLHSEDTPFSFNRYRVSTPLIKPILFGGVEKVVPLPEKSEKQIVLFGVKTCDLASLPVMDYVFMQGDFTDPIYSENRQRVTIVSSDCSDCLQTCFCTLVGNNPYPEKYFDANLSPIRDGYIFTVATEKGQKLINIKYLQKVSDNQLKMMEENRQKIRDKVTNQISSQNYSTITSTQKAVMDNYESETWEKVAENCVECGGCNLVCPTCHCFVLSDHDNNRYRQWDACQYKGFAVVAGGANPRHKLYERLRNRYIKKFDFFQKNINLNGCTGCGRCINACIGKIDIRDVLKKLVTK